MIFDLVLGSTITRQYKPNPASYLAALNAFDLKENQYLAFVAAHYYDLLGAAEQYVYVFDSAQSAAVSALTDFRKEAHF